MNSNMLRSSLVCYSFGGTADPGMWIGRPPWRLILFGDSKPDIYNERTFGDFGAGNNKTSVCAKSEYLEGVILWIGLKSNSI